jgi:hypothetical protein
VVVRAFALALRQLAEDEAQQGVAR